MRAIAGLLAVPALCAAGASAALAQGAAASGVATATVITAITVREIADLDFGVIRGGMAANGAVTLIPGRDQPRYTGGARAACAGPQCPPPHPARFTVTGEAHRSYGISVPPAVAADGSPVEPGSPIPALSVDGFAVRSTGRPDSRNSGQLDGQGRDSFELGGTLRLPAGLPPARYRASVPVTVSYN